MLNSTGKVVDVSVATVMAGENLSFAVPMALNLRRKVRLLSDERIGAAPARPQLPAAFAVCALTVSWSFAPGRNFHEGKNLCAISA